MLRIKKRVNITTIREREKAAVSGIATARSCTEWGWGSMSMG